MTDRLRNNLMYDMQDVFDRLYADSKNGSNCKKLYDIVVSKNNILLAYRGLKSKSNSYTAGLDGLTLNDIQNLKEEELVEQVQRKFRYYQPRKVKRVYIPKQDGSARPLGIPSIWDRLIQQCILQVLDPICEARFYNHSYGFRPNRSAIHALSRTVTLINRGKMYYVVDVDIKNFFDNVNHSILMKKLWSFGIRDKKLLSIIRKILESEIADEGKQTKGIVQGGVLSPLLANVYLNELDFWVRSQWEDFPIGGKNIHSFHNSRAKKTNLKSGYIVRYADDFKIMCRSYTHALRFYYAVIDFLEKRLGLEVNVSKSSVTNLKKRSTDFLGFSIKVIAKGNTKNAFVAQTNMSESTKARVYQELREAVKAIQYNSYSAKSSQLYNYKVLGIKNYFQYATHIYLDLDHMGMSLYKVIYNRLRDRGYYVSYASLNEIFKKNNVGLRAQTKIMVVGGHTPLYVINAVKHKNPMNFQQKITPYTKEGRKQMRGVLENTLNRSYYRYLLDRVSYSKHHRTSSVEYLDNRLSKYLAQNGRCYVTGLVLHPREMHCHHIKPYSKDCDDYHNLVWLTQLVHTLLHAVQKDVILKYLNELDLDKDQLSKLNCLRVKAGLDLIEV